MPIVLDRPHVFERGDRIYFTMPVQKANLAPERLEELAFASRVKQMAPNENIRWFAGQYVEADNPNANGAQWRSGELAIKGLTPMLMPVTVMHDPRTAVGTIADVKLMTPETDGVPRARIDNIIALWAHRFPEVVEEADHNAEQGTLMQSMECYSPWYECSVCGSTYHKLPSGAEQAQWCQHLKASNPNAGYVDLAHANGSPNASRILGDVTFTGTGLIFGTRGARGAYSEAHLRDYEEEVAEFHTKLHTDTHTPRRVIPMGLVQIEDTELAKLRADRDAAVDAQREEQRKREEAERDRDAKVAAAEAQANEEKAKREQAEASAAKLQEEKAQADLKSTRMSSFGSGFVAKLGAATKASLESKAGTLDEAAWDNEVKVIEEAVGVNRDAQADSNGKHPANSGGGGNDPEFKPEEIASALRVNSGGGGGSADLSGTVKSLGGLFTKTPARK
jgi:hypothetical protein